MPPPGPPALQLLHQLDSSSSQFPDELCNILYGEEYLKCVYGEERREERRKPILQDDDLMWLVDYLDTVRRHIPLPHFPLTPAQTLSVLDPSSVGFRKCLRQLRTICGARGILPTLYTLSSVRLTVSPVPFASGGYGDVYEGSLDGSSVCAKRMRIYIRDGPEKAVKVRWRGRFPRPPPLTELTELLPRGRNVETHCTPKRPPSTWHHHRPLPAHFELDAWRRPARISQGEPPNRSTGIGRYPSSSAQPALTPVTSF